MNMSRWLFVSSLGRVFAFAVICAALGAAQGTGGQLARKRYVDPKGYFAIVPPDQWGVQEYPQDPRGKVAFNAPDANVDLRVLVNAVDFSTVDDLVAFCRSVEGRIGISTNIERVQFGGRAAVKRVFELRGMRMYYIDFLVGNVDHNLAFAAPPRVYEKHLPAVLKSMETYEPIQRNVSDRDVIQHTVAKKKRLAQLMIDNGNLDLAAVYVKEGLDLSPKDPDLLRFNERLVAAGKTKR